VLCAELETLFRVLLREGCPQLRAFFWCAEHAQQLGGASPLPNLMVVKG
jgi:hypothetical protein